MSTYTLQPEQIDAELDQVQRLQMVWKNPLMRRTATAIIKAGLEANGSGEFWPDNEAITRAVDSLSDQDKNVVGSTWRLLGQVGIIQRGEKRRRSTSGPSRGREIAEWRIVSRPVAMAFLKRNDVEVDTGQKELFAAAPVSVAGLLK